MCPPTSLAGAGTEEHPPHHHAPLLGRFGAAGVQFTGCVLQGLMNLQELDTGEEYCGYKHPSPPERYRSLQGLFFEVPAVMQGLWRATGAGNSVVEVCFLDSGWGFLINPNILSQEAFPKGLSTTGRLLLGWGKPKAAHAKRWFSFFPS